MPACHLKQDDKKAFIGKVGNDLVRTHGKQSYYKPIDIRRSAERGGFPADIHCWAYCIFSSPQDFKALHDAAGEIRDYSAMRAKVLTEFANGVSFSIFYIDLSWLEWPDIDLFSVFDGFDLLK